MKKIKKGNKGISLAVETVIVIILAAAVMAALLLFFRQTWGWGTGDIDNIKRQTELCQKYLGLDTTCSKELFGAVSSEIPFSALQDICKKIAGFEPSCRDNPVGKPEGVDASWYCAAKCCASYGCSPP